MSNSMTITRTTCLKQETTNSNTLDVPRASAAPRQSTIRESVVDGAKTTVYDETYGSYGYSARPRTTRREVTTPTTRTVQREIIVPETKTVSRTITVPVHRTVEREISVPVTTWEKRIIKETVVENETRVVEDEIIVQTKKIIEEEVTVPVKKIITETEINPEEEISSHHYGRSTAYEGLHRHNVSPSGYRTKSAYPASYGYSSSCYRTAARPCCARPCCGGYNGSKATYSNYDKWGNGYEYTSGGRNPGYTYTAPSYDYYGHSGIVSGGNRWW